MIRANTFFDQFVRRAALAGVLALATSALVAQAQVFSTPKNISNNAGNSLFPRIAADSKGNINVVWQDDTPGSSNIFFSRSADGGATFSTPKNLSNNSAGAFVPLIAVDSSGNINVVWNGNGNSGIFFSRSSDGGATFSTPKNLSSNSVRLGEPHMAVDSSGSINVVWISEQPSLNIRDILFSRSSDGGVTFSTPTNVSKNGIACCASPQIAVDSTGNINVVWAGLLGFVPIDIFFSRSADGGATFSAPKLISDTTGGEDSNISSVQIAVDSSGNIDVIWSGEVFPFPSPIQENIFFAHSRDGGATFSAPKNLSNSAGLSLSPQMAVDSSGGINVVWWDNRNGGVFFSRSNDGGTTFSASKSLSDILGSTPQIALDSSGNINVVWPDSSPGNTDIFLSRSTDGGTTFSTPNNLSNNSGSSFAPQIALDFKGDINAVWADNTPGNFDIFAGGTVSVCSPQSPTPGTFIPTGSMSTPRAEHTATLLPNGKVLIAGGTNRTNIFPGAELYDPSTGMFVSAGGLVTPRHRHTTTLLTNGKVLIAGGDSTILGLTAAELYDPSSGSFSATGSMTTGRSYHTATLLQTGKVLVTGGIGPSGINNGAELYDPVSDTFANTGSMQRFRYAHTATLLPNGLVLITGGVGIGTEATAEIYDPSTEIFTLLASSMTTSRAYHTATLLPNGKVLLAGGLSFPGNSLSTAELFDPATNTFTLTGSMTTPRFLHTATLLSHGQVLVAGGDGNTILVNDSAELYDPVTSLFAPTGSMSVARDRHTATLLSNGSALVAGGSNGIIFLASAEIYSATTCAIASPTITSVSPTSGIQGQTITNFTVNGNNFQPTSTISFSGTGITVNSYISRTVTQIVASVNVASSASTGVQNVIVTNLDGQQSTFTNAFTVAPLTLSLCPVSSSSCTQSISFAYRAGSGSSTQPQQVAVSTNGPAIPFTATTRSSSTSPNPLMFVSPTSGTTPSTLNVSVAPNLSPGTYTGGLTVLAPGAANSPAIMGITLIVSTPSTVPGQGIMVFRWPLDPDLDRSNLNQDYAEFDHIGTQKFHVGVDIGAPSGISVFAVAGGHVKLVPMLPSNEANPDNHCMGNVVIIDHSSGGNGRGPFTLYAHLQEIDSRLQDGQQVSQGDVVGTVGSTGFNQLSRRTCQGNRAAGPH